jgi:hypothetical protein
MGSGNGVCVTENCYIKYLGGSTGSLAAFITAICDMFDAVSTDKKLSSVSVVDIGNQYCMAS